MNMIPLHKNGKTRHYEAFVGEHHIQVPFDVFDLHLTAHKDRRVERGENPNAAADAAYFDLIDSEHWNTPNWWAANDGVDPYNREGEKPPKGATEAGDGTWSISWDVFIDGSGDEAALERMANYFQHKYQLAKDGSVEESRYASVYVQILSALTRRQLVESVDQVSAHLSDLGKMLSDSSHELATAMSAMGVAIALLNGKEGDDEPRTPTSNSQL